MLERKISAHRFASAGTIGAQRDGAHRFGSQFVVPSLLSLIDDAEVGKLDRASGRTSGQFLFARAGGAFSDDCFDFLSFDARDP